MSYLRYKEKFGDVLIDLEGIRFVKEVGKNPAGGAPNVESGEIRYSDGFVLPVSRGCAQAVQAAFKSRTVPQRGNLGRLTDDKESHNRARGVDYTS